jgi:hypothetical protein
MPIQEDPMSKCQVVIVCPSNDRTAFVRALRTAGSIGLKQASDLAVYFERFRRSVLVAGVDLPVAEHLAGCLRDAGTEVELQPSSIGTPMLCAPEVNAKYGWGALRQIKKLA